VTKFSEDALLLHVMCPDIETAVKIGDTLLEQKLCIHANIEEPV
jgi:hypothetical protein